MRVFLLYHEIVLLCSEPLILYKHARAHISTLVNRFGVGV